MKLFPFIAVAAAIFSNAEAAVTFTDTFNVSAAIPDSDAAGFVSRQTITAGAGGVPQAEEILFITNVKVELTFSGGWNGDLYVYLSHGSGFTILLNRIGRDTATPDGNPGSGMNITLSDDALLDVHSASSPIGILTGNYLPDGRASDPSSVTGGDERTTLFSSFNGLNASGEWTLFVADVSGGDQSTLQNWALTVTAVPEQSAALLVAASSVALLKRRRGRI